MWGPGQRERAQSSALDLCLLFIPCVIIPKQCPYPSRASPCLHFPVCKKLAMIPTLFFRDSFFFFLESVLTPAAEKSQTLLRDWPRCVGWKQAASEDQAAFFGARRAGVAGGAWLSFTSWTAEVISVGHHFGLKIDFIRWKWTEEMNCKPHSPIAALTKCVIQPYVPGRNEYTETTYFERSSDFSSFFKV